MVVVARFVCFGKNSGGHWSELTCGHCSEANLVPKLPKWNLEWSLMIGGSEVVISTCLFVHDKLRHRYTIIVLYHIMDLLYDRLYTTSRSFEPHDIRECRVAGVYFIESNILTICRLWMPSLTTEQGWDSQNLLRQSLKILVNWSFKMPWVLTIK